MSIKDKAIKNILRRKMQAEQIADQNLDFVLKDDRVKALFVKCKKLVVEIAKTDVNGGDSKLKRNEYNKNRELMSKILKDLGIDKSKLKPQYQCLKCKDTGYIGNAECDCLKQEISKLQIQECGVDINTLPKFNDDFSIFNDNKEIVCIYKKMKKFIEELDTVEKNNIVILGNTGVGKTYLINCMLSYSIELYRKVKYTTMFAFNQSMLKYHLAKIEDKDALINPFLNSEILFIDDLGSENKINNITNEYLYLILNERMQNNKKTVITTNLDFKAIQDTYGERIFSRLLHKKQSLILKFPGDDLRINVK